jgi:hypothetical protein
MRSPKVEDLPNGKKAGSITVALGGFEDEDGKIDAVPAAVFMVEDFEARYILALRFALQERTTVCAAVNPSTLALFASTLETHREALARALHDGTLGVDPARIGSERAALLGRRVRSDVDAAKRLEQSARMRDALPHLAGLVCWKGGSAPWYLEKLKASYGELPVLDYGYCASEGCFGAPVDAASAHSILVPHGHVIELAPVDAIDDVRAGRASTVLLHEAEVGQRYVPIVTTGAGLYRYDMNDVIEVTGKLGHAPLVVFRHKAGAMASITGEKVGESHVVAAAARSALPGAGFCAAPVLPSEGAPYWVIAIDAGAQTVDLDAAAGAFDDALRIENLEYDAKRASLRLARARAVLLPSGAVAKFRAQRVAGGAPDAHVKVPHVSPDGALLISLGVDETLAAQLPVRAGAKAA